MDKHILPIQSDLYYLCMFGCRLFCLARLFGKTEEFVINNRHVLIYIGAIDTQYEILDVNKLIRYFIGKEKAEQYGVYFITINDNELVDGKVIVPMHDDKRGEVVGIMKKYISNYNGEYKYHWVLQYTDDTPDYNTVTTCTAIKYGHIDTKSVMLIYKK